MKVPFVSAGMKILTAGYSDGSLPRLHIGVVRLGTSPDGIVADRWHFRGDDLNAAYNTTQVFSEVYPHGIHSLLSSWHLSAKVGIPEGFVGPVRIPQDHVVVTPRPLPPKPPHKHMTKFLAFALLLGVVIGVAGTHYGEPVVFPAKSVADASKAIKYADSVTGRGFITNNGAVSVVLSDGRILSPMQFKTDPSGWEAEISDGIWVKGGLQ
jgi:hypothetical protein